MRLDFLALALVFIIAISAILVTYGNAILILYNYDNYAWILAEQAAELLRQGRSIETNAYIIVTLITLNNTKTYTIGIKPSTVLGRAYTYRILGNNTLMRVEVWVSSTYDYVKESP